ncbi:hypothetical protein F511_02649 [Dorcoceras hygrometricum]|uniref:CCHC-type domain-containing protein n=1 Tax=Dorcoceras hygrometricum TaxID=472368 RepID=A0A2Z7D5A2_9LAMI|nr:hypothetical protein F511_02649 [Dorcoceras hygrometricum]
MLFYLTTLNLVRFLREDAPIVAKNVTDKDKRATFEAWGHGDFLCLNYVLNGLDNSLYNVYSPMTTAKLLWESLEKKYKTEGAGLKKFIVGKFLDYKMVDSKYVMSQVQEMQLILHDLHAEGIEMGDSFEYVKKFDRGCHISPLIADDPVEKLQHFPDGLSPMIRRDVLMVDPTDYEDALKRSFTSEQTLKDIRTEAQKKRPFQMQPQQQTQAKRPFTGPQRQQGQGTARPAPRPTPSGRPQSQQALRPGPSIEKPTCQSCGRKHARKCLKRVGVCYKCKQPGHLSFECPQLSQPAMGRVFVMQAEEADPDTTQEGYTRRFDDLQPFCKHPVTEPRSRQRVCYRLNNEYNDGIKLY